MSVSSLKQPSLLLWNILEDLLECLVGELLHLLSKQLLGGVCEHVVEVTPGPTTRMAL